MYSTGSLKTACTMLVMEDLGTLLPVFTVLVLMEERRCVDIPRTLMSVVSRQVSRVNIGVIFRHFVSLQ